jgi:hypothetical protein
LPLSGALSSKEYQVNRIIISIVVIFLSSFSHANEFSFDDASINIPVGFEGPIKKNMGQGASTIAFQNLHEDGSNATLLQITTWNPGKTFPEMTDVELKKGAVQYLEQFLSGVARKRSHFEKSEIEYINISGVPVAKVNWTGEIDSKKAHGIMYCYVFNSKIISLHTQDLVKFNGLYLNQAVKAFESIKLAR